MACGVVHGDDSVLIAPLAVVDGVAAVFALVAGFVDEVLFGLCAVSAGWDLVAWEIFVLPTAGIVDGAIGAGLWGCVCRDSG